LQTRVTLFVEAIALRTKTPHLAEHVLDVAARLFGTKRFHEVRMDDLAAEAEVSKGTLYRYFKDKEELYRALLERATRQLLARLRDCVTRAAGARARLTALVAAILDHFDGNPHLFDLIQRAEVLRRPGAAFPWQRVRDESVHLVREVLEEGTRRGELAVGDPGLAVLMLLGGLRSVIRFGPLPRPPRLAEHIVETFLGGVDGRG
jgi:TetR/AcrR family fatty acid metabolism transcriptional regulator